MTMASLSCSTFSSSQNSAFCYDPISIGALKTSGSTLAPSKRFNSINQYTQRCQAHLQAGTGHDINPIVKSKNMNSRASTEFTPSTVQEPQLLRRKNHRLQVSKSETILNSDHNINNTLLDDDHDDADAAGPPQLQQPKPTNSVLKWLDILNRFVRPHILMINVVTVTSVSLLPLTGIADLTPKFFMGFAWVFVISVLMNLYVVTVNQLYDVEIDKINKPYLPLASGEISMPLGTLITASFPTLGLILALLSGSHALVGYVLVTFYLGISYSAKGPTLRWKENPFLAALHVTLWGGVPQIAFFMHMQMHVLQRQMVWSKQVLFPAAIMSCLSFVLALIKDLPDVEGDRENGVKTFAIWFGPEKVLNFCVAVMMAAYGISMGIGGSSTNIVSRIVSVLGHGACAAVFWLQSQKVDLNSNSSTTQLDLLIYKLLAVQHVLVQFMR